MPQKRLVVKSSREVRSTIADWGSDRFILGRTHATEGNDSHVGVVAADIADNVELESI
jgi:hypothetical protein